MSNNENDYSDLYGYDSRYQRAGYGHRDYYGYRR